MIHYNHCYWLNRIYQRRTTPEGRVNFQTEDIVNALRKGSHVCILCSEVSDPLFANLLSNSSIRFIKSLEPTPQLSVKRSEFTTFLNTYANSRGIFTSETNFKSVIRTVRNVAIAGLEPRENITYHQGE